MLSDDFLEAFADFYGSFSLDELAERFDVSTFELVELFEPLVDNNLDFFEEEMGYNESETEDED